MAKTRLLEDPEVVAFRTEKSVCSQSARVTLSKVSADTVKLFVIDGLLGSRVMLGLN